MCITWYYLTFCSLLLSAIIVLICFIGQCAKCFSILSIDWNKTQPVLFITPIYAQWLFEHIQVHRFVAQVLFDAMTLKPWLCDSFQQAFIRRCAVQGCCRWSAFQPQSVPVYIQSKNVQLHRELFSNPTACPTKIDRRKEEVFFIRIQHIIETVSRQRTWCHEPTIASAQ